MFHYSRPAKRCNCFWGNRAKTEKEKEVYVMKVKSNDTCCFFLILSHRGTNHHILWEEIKQVKFFKMLKETVQKNNHCTGKNVSPTATATRHRAWQSLQPLCFLICTSVTTDDCQVQLTAHQVENSPYFPTDRGGRTLAQRRKAVM